MLQSWQAGRKCTPEGWAGLQECGKNTQCPYFGCFEFHSHLTTDENMQERNAVITKQFMLYVIAPCLYACTYTMHSNLLAARFQGILSEPSLLTLPYNSIILGLACWYRYSCPSTHLSTHTSVHLYIFPSIHNYTHQYICPLIYLSINIIVSVCRYICPSIHLSINISFHWYICLLVHLSIRLFSRLVYQGMIVTTTLYSLGLQLPVSSKGIQAQECNGRLSVPSTTSHLSE